MFHSLKCQFLACIIAVFFINSSVVAKANEPCTTPEGATGTCVSIVDCPPLLTVLRNTQRTPEQTAFLQESQCDLIERIPYVCCNFQKENRFNIPPADGLSLLPSTRECGKSFDNRIIGGNVTRIDEYPWLALIEYTKPGNNKGFHCGATLINKRYVITAAHCVTGRGIPADWSVTGIRLGEWDRSTDRDCERSRNNRLDCADPHIDVGVEQIIFHPNYVTTAPNNLNDIALIRLNREIAYSDFVSPVCLPVQQQLRSKVFANVKLDVTGFGATETGSSSALKLKATIDAWTLEACRGKYSPRKIYLQETQMCAGGQAGTDSCSGDSGGPLVIKQKVDNRDVYILAGIVSFGPKPCGLAGWPGVYTRVGAYADWILSTIRA